MLNFVSSNVKKRLTAAEQYLAGLAHGENIAVDPQLKSGPGAGMFAALENLGSQWQERHTEATQSVEAAKKKSSELAGMRYMMDSMNAQVMFANSDRVITYLNPAMERMLKICEADIRKAQPDFSADNVAGRVIDVFHKNPAHQAKVLSELNGTHVVELRLGNRVFRLIVNPVSSPEGERIGSVVEWMDVTHEDKALQTLAELAVAVGDGNLDARCEIDNSDGFVAKVGAEVNTVVDAMVRPLRVAADYVDKISSGNIPEPITDDYRGEFNTIKENLNSCIESINFLIEDAGRLATAAVDGELATRADASRHKGDYRRIVQGVNDTLDAVIGPLNVAATYVDRISKGDIPEPITDAYNGDFNTIKDNLNRAIDAVNKMIDDANMLSEAAVAGALDTRADANKHEGQFRAIVEGVNNTLDAVIGPLNVAATYVDRISKGDIPEPITDAYNGDFNTIKNNLNRAIDAVNKMIDDANMLSRAAVDGALDTRANADKHEGKFRAIVEGVNNTLDAVIGPLNVAATYVDRISKGDIPEPITDAYNGDFNTIKNNLNRAIDAVNKMIDDA
ncbi:MAG: HAMP domain-containing protein, partial [Oceanococcaceae bacterium]